MQSVKCAAHSLQLAVKDYLDEVNKDLLKRIRDLAKALRTPTYRFVVRKLLWFKFLDNKFTIILRAKPVIWTYQMFP